jgi:hypothetical protein
VNTSPAGRFDQYRGLINPLVFTQSSPRSKCAAIDVPASVLPQHPFAQLVAQPVHHPVIRAHSLRHDLRRHAHHMRVPDLPPLHHAHNGHPRRQLPRLRIHAQDPDIGRLQRRQNRLRRRLQWPPKIVQQ